MCSSGSAFACSIEDNRAAESTNALVHDVMDSDSGFMRLLSIARGRTDENRFRELARGPFQAETVPVTVEDRYIVLEF